jgi:uncharacterized membrane protein YphA (DoxX/SURF4 family)
LIEGGFGGLDLLPSSLSLDCCLRSFSLIFKGFDSRLCWVGIAWAVPADDAFIAQLLFFKNIAVTGGLLMLASSGAGFISFDSLRAKG